MSLKAFLWAAEALRLEEGVTFVTSKAVPAPADVRQRNQDAMANLMGMMGGVQKRRRR